MPEYYAGLTKKESASGSVVYLLYLHIDILGVCVKYNVFIVHTCYCCVDSM